MHAGDDPVGLCVPPTQVGETCGQTANAVVVCTGEQSCQDGQAGATCQADSAGEGEGEGE